MSLTNSINSSTLSIILASTSPRRKQLLALTEIDFTTMAVDIDETPLDRELPVDYIQRMVAQKAISAAALMANIASAQPKQAIASSPVNRRLVNKRLVITADTIGVLPDGVQILIKPKNRLHAFAMWQKMSGRAHYVWTAVQLSIINHQGDMVEKMCFVEKTKVEFIPLTLQQMQAYWLTGEPIDKAGGYAIQGKGAAWVNAICGSYTNVVGLPLAQTLRAIESIQDTF